MRRALIKLAIMLCVLVQALWGSAYRPGVDLCVRTTLPGHADQCACEDGCRNHAPVRAPCGPANLPGREDEKRCPSCVDISMPSSGLPEWVAGVAHLDVMWLIAGCAAVGWSGVEDGTHGSLARRGADPPGGGAGGWRTACGVRTTRLLI